MDESETRRGVPCWHKNEGVGLEAINDSGLMHNGIFLILKKYFSNHHCYLPVLELMYDTMAKTSMGETFETMYVVSGKPQLDRFTMERYDNVVKYKTAFYSLQLPVTVAMYLAGKYEAELHKQANTVLLEIGHLVQVQNDFLDCFGDPELTGKKGDDIRGGRYSWLVIVALQRATLAQRKILEEHYGSSAPESEAIVRNLYEELRLPDTYYVYEKECYSTICTHIQQISGGLPHDLFFKFLQAVYKRQS